MSRGGFVDRPGRPVALVDAVVAVTSPFMLWLFFAGLVRIYASGGDRLTSRRKSRHAQRRYGPAAGPKGGF